MNDNIMNDILKDLYETNIPIKNIIEKYDLNISPRIIKVVVFRVPLQKLWYNIV